MLDSLITSKTRLRLLMKFFINGEATAYLRNLSNEFGESTNGIRQELNRFEEAKLIGSELVQNKKIYKANTSHPYFKDIHHLLLKYTGIDQMVELVVLQLGDLEQAYVLNDFAQGKPGKVLDILLVGNQFDQDFLHQLVRKAEEKLPFQVRYQTANPADNPALLLEKSKSLLVWSKGETVQN